MRLLFPKRILLLLVLCWGFFSSAQYTIPEKPTILYPVYDEVNLLSKQEKDLLNQKLIKFEDSTSTEIMVIIIPSTKGEDVNFLATMFGEKWKIGKKKTDNGIVFLISTEDRKMAIQQGRAVEQYLTASTSGQILDYLVAPHFKRGNWYKGIDQATDAIIEATQGKFNPQKKERSIPKGMIVFLIVIFIIFIIIASNSRNGGGMNGGFDDFDDVIISRRGRRNYPGGFHSFPNFGGNDSGGGFGGFGGGGSFGGGGASGSW